MMTGARSDEADETMMARNARTTVCFSSAMSGASRLSADPMVAVGSRNREPLSV
jgi:hypothetical protein